MDGKVPWNNLQFPEIMRRNASRWPDPDFEN
jgi:hypothetical protein